MLKFKLLIVIVTSVFLTACTTTGARLTDLSLNMSKAEVKSVLGNPEYISLAFIDPEGHAIEVLDYRLYQYYGAIDGLSPYYDVYSFFFKDDSLVRWRKSKENARLSEKMVMRMLYGR